MITVQQLSAITGGKVSRLNAWIDPLNGAMQEFGITTPARVAAFIAQVAHESGSFQYVREIWNPAQCPWQKRYEGRADLGNTQVGDGARFKGRGLIQLTGRANYRACGEALGMPLENNPELLEVPRNAARSAGWFWQKNNLNKWADAGDIDGVSDVINRGRKTARIGDANGYAERLAFFERAKQILI